MMRKAGENARAGRWISDEEQGQDGRMSGETGQSQGH